MDEEEWVQFYANEILRPIDEEKVLDVWHDLWLTPSAEHSGRPKGEPLPPPLPKGAQAPPGSADAGLADECKARAPGLR